MAAINTTSIDSHIRDYSKWRQQMHDDVAEFQDWLKREDLSDIHVENNGHQSEAGGKYFSRFKLRARG